MSSEKNGGSGGPTDPAEREQERARERDRKRTVPEVMADLASTAPGGVPAPKTTGPIPVPKQSSGPQPPSAPARVEGDWATELLADLGTSRNEIVDDAPKRLEEMRAAAASDATIDHPLDAPPPGTMDLRAMSAPRPGGVSPGDPAA